MKLFLISQDENNGYDTCDSAVVCAKNIEGARNTAPGKAESWCSSPDLVTVVYLGEADGEIPPGVVLASFHGS